MPVVFVFSVPFNPYSAEGGIIDWETETQRLSDLPKGHTGNDRKLERKPTQVFFQL